MPRWLWRLTCRALTRFGGGRFAIGPASLVVRGRSVPWSAIEEIRVQPADVHNVGALPDRLVDRVAALLPWYIPGPMKRGLIRPCVEFITNLAWGLADVVAADRGRLVPYEIVYRDRIRLRHRLDLGIFAIQILTLSRAVNDSFAATAAQHDVRVRIEQTPPAGSAPPAQHGPPPFGDDVPSGPTDRGRWPTWATYPADLRRAPEPAGNGDLQRVRRTWKISLAVWGLTAAFWLVAAAVAGYIVFWGVFLLGATLLLPAARWFGLDRIPAPIVYIFACLPGFAFFAVKWNWPIALVILAMIFSYEMALETGGQLLAAKDRLRDQGKVVLRATRVSLILIAFDALAAGLDIVFFVLLLVAAVRLRPLSTVLATLVIALSFATFLAAGDPSFYWGLGEPGFHAPGDIYEWFTVWTFLGALVGFAKALHLIWSGRIQVAR
jgi:hypothetical protein